MRLVGRSALVTGGGRGIGKAIAADLLRGGPRVTLLEVEPEHASVAPDRDLPGSVDGGNHFRGLFSYRDVAVKEGVV